MLSLGLFQCKCLVTYYRPTTVIHSLINGNIKNSALPVLTLFLIHHALKQFPQQVEHFDCRRPYFDPPSVMKSNLLHVQE